MRCEHSAVDLRRSRPSAAGAVYSSCGVFVAALLVCVSVSALLSITPGVAATVPELGTRAISPPARPPRAGELLTRAQAAEAAGDSKRALESYNQAIELEPENLRAHLLRGGLRFKLGQIEGSIRDFDRVIELAPEQEPYLWQRGISLYYAGRLADCARQFESHRWVNGDDVENAAWHFLCVARLHGVAAAGKALLPVGSDPRVPMAEIYGLFAGKVAPAQVLDRARAVRGVGRAQALFYAHLYLGLYAEARDEATRARSHYEQAVAQGFRHYMGEVASVALTISLED